MTFIEEAKAEHELDFTGQWFIRDDELFLQVVTSRWPFADKTKPEVVKYRSIRTLFLKKHEKTVYPHDVWTPYGWGYISERYIVELQHCNKEG